LEHVFVDYFVVLDCFICNITFCGWFDVSSGI